MEFMAFMYVSFISLRKSPGWSTPIWCFHLFSECKRFMFPVKSVSIALSCNLLFINTSNFSTSAKHKKTFLWYFKYFLVIFCISYHLFMCTLKMWASTDECSHSGMGKKPVPLSCFILLTLTTSSSVERHLMASETSVTEASIPIVTTFTGTATVLPVSTAVFKISES